jgi:hypothetical protein
MLHVPDVVLGIVAVLLGCLGASFAAYAAIRGGNWLAYVSAVGCAAFVAGVIGQQAFPSAAAVARLGAAAAQSSIPGPWDAGVSLPAVPLRLTPVAIGGALVAALGLSLVLLFERVPGPVRTAPAPPRPLAEDDSV